MIFGWLPHSQDKLKYIEVDLNIFYARKHVSRDCNNETNKRTNKQTSKRAKKENYVILYKFSVSHFIYMISSKRLFNTQVSLSRSKRTQQIYLFNQKARHLHAYLNLKQFTSTKIAEKSFFLLRVSSKQLQQIILVLKNVI